jgi:hypothetical protein
MNKIEIDISEKKLYILASMIFISMFFMALFWVLFENETKKSNESCKESNVKYGLYLSFALISTLSLIISSLLLYYIYNYYFSK